jgi:hypothetical protein
LKSSTAALQSTTAAPGALQLHGSGAAAYYSCITLHHYTTASYSCTTAALQLRWHDLDAADRVVWDPEAEDRKQLDVRLPETNKPNQPTNPTLDMP